MEIDSAAVLGWYLRLGENTLLSWYVPLFAVIAGIALIGGRFLCRQAFSFRSFIQAVKEAYLPLVFLTLGCAFLLLPVECSDFFREQKEKAVVLVGGDSLSAFVYGSAPSASPSAPEPRQDLQSSPPVVRVP